MTKVQIKGHGGISVPFFGTLVSQCTLSPTYVLYIKIADEVK